MGLILTPRGTVAMSGVICGCHNYGDGATWHLLGREQGCCYTRDNAQQSATTKKYLAADVHSLKWKGGKCLAIMPRAKTIKIFIVL